jgi:hypothetical protein
MNQPFLPSDLPPVDPLRLWAKAATVRAIAHLRDRTVTEVAHEFYGKGASEIATKAAVSPASTTGWGSATAGQRIGAFLKSLRPRSAAAQLFDRAPRLDMAGVATIGLPGLSGEYPAPAWVGEGEPIPAQKGTLGSVQLGPPKKLAAIAGLTGELVNLSAENAETIIREIMDDAAAKALDASLFSDAAASALRPAGIMNGVTPIAGTAGGGLAALNADLKAIAGAMAAAGVGTSFLLFANPVQAVSISILAPGPYTFEIIPTPALAVGTLVAVQPEAFASGFGDVPTIDIAKSALIHWEDATPAHIGTEGSPNVAAARVTSGFQTDVAALRLILRAAWVVRQSGAVQYVTGATF